MIEKEFDIFDRKKERVPFEIYQGLTIMIENNDRYTRILKDDDRNDKYVSVYIDNETTATINIECECDGGREDSAYIKIVAKGDQIDETLKGIKPVLYS